ncbi:MAG: sulfur carrier protein ThiS [Alphaproteobacteria bacterium]
MSLDIRINGAARTVAASTIVEILREEGVDENARFVAVALNGSVVPRRNWAEKCVSAGDDVEIVKPVSGG